MQQLISIEDWKNTEQWKEAFRFLRRLISIEDWKSLWDVPSVDGTTFGWVDFNRRLKARKRSETSTHCTSWFQSKIESIVTATCNRTYISWFQSKIESTPRSTFSTKPFFCWFQSKIESRFARWVRANRGLVDFNRRLKEVTLKLDFLPIADFSWFQSKIESLILPLRARSRSGWFQSKIERPPAAQRPPAKHRFQVDFNRRLKVPNGLPSTTRPPRLISIEDWKFGMGVLLDLVEDVTVDFNRRLKEPAS